MKGTGSSSIEVLSKVSEPPFLGARSQQGKLQLQDLSEKVVMCQKPGAWPALAAAAPAGT